MHKSTLLHAEARTDERFVSAQTACVASKCREGGRQRPRGAYGCTISGAGPTCVAVVADAQVTVTTRAPCTTWAMWLKVVLLPFSGAFRMQSACAETHDQFSKGAMSNR